MEALTGGYARITAKNQDKEKNQGQASFYKEDLYCVSIKCPIYLGGEIIVKLTMAYFFHYFFPTYTMKKWIISGFNKLCLHHKKQTEKEKPMGVSHISP